MTKRKYYIYKHTFPNNKVYIGITCQKPELRWGKNGEGYLQLNKQGKPTQAKIYNAIKKYGWENIKHEVIEVVFSKEEAEKQERYYITEVYKSQFAKYGYNIMRGGDYNGKFTAKTKKKISRSIKQAYQTSEALWMKRFTSRSASFFVILLPFSFSCACLSRVRASVSTCTKGPLPER